MCGFWLWPIKFNWHFLRLLSLLLLSNFVVVVVVDIVVVVNVVVVVALLVVTDHIIYSCDQEILI